MSVAAGAGLLLVVLLGWQLLKNAREVPTEGYAMAFAVLGSILTLTGAHMTLTWPLAPTFPFDNIIFGEPALAFGVLMLVAAMHLWRRGPALHEAPDALAAFSRAYLPVSVFVVGMGLGSFGIAAAGIRYTLFAAPPEEPIAGQFADHPMVEAVFISGLYILVGIGAVLFPLALRARRTGGVATVVAVSWALAGLAFLLFGALNYFTHIGLIVNTM